MYPSDRYDPGAVLSSVNLWAASSDPEGTAARFPLYGSLRAERVVLNPATPSSFRGAGGTPPRRCPESGPGVSLSVRSMTPWYWLLNLPDRVLERAFWWGLWDSGQGNVELGQTVVREELGGGGGGRAPNPPPPEMCITVL